MINNIITIALRGLVFFPEVEVTFDVGRKQSLAALNAAVEKDEKLFLIAQKDQTDDFVDEKSLNRVGVVAEILQVTTNNKSKASTVTVRPLYRAELIEFRKDNKYITCDVREVKQIHGTKEEEQAHINILESAFSEFVEVCGFDVNNVPADLVFPKNLSYFTDFLAFTIFHDPEAKQSLLEENDVCARALGLAVKISELLKTLTIERDLDAEVQEAIDKNQDEFYLREKLNIIKKRLEGDKFSPNYGVDEDNEIDELISKLQSLEIDEKDKNKLIKEAKKLHMMQPGSMDANVIRSYLEEIISIPWGVYSDTDVSSSLARMIIEQDHYGLEKVKERFVELVAVHQYTDNPGAQVICLVGPPGVGKTSIVSSVAKAMDRKFVRMSLGGVHDEAEIRGHRRTYVGAMPGRIVSALKQAGTMNPIILLDEIDKLANDGRGDPSSAMLEVLDPAQNSTFRDNFVSIPVDLSKVIFVTTANDPSRIPEPLYDRMEIIEVSGYTFEEKVQIAKKHLIKKQRKQYNLTANQFKLPDSSLKYLINHYTREAGVRRLEQLISALCRKALVEIDETGINTVSITSARLKKYLGAEKFKDDDILKTDETGVVNGLAWTAVGGEMLQVEAVMMPGSGKIEITGNLGDVMKESAKAAYSYIRANASRYNINDEVFTKKDIHIHVPQGAVPKDGPSAGVTISTALLSALTGRTFKHNVAMTGEISLTGRVMPIGGLREKSMAAYRHNITDVIIPYDNLPDLEEVHETVRKNVVFRPVKKLEEVFEISLNA